MLIEPAINTVVVEFTSNKKPVARGARSLATGLLRKLIDLRAVKAKWLSQSQNRETLLIASTR